MIVIVASTDLWLTPEIVSVVAAAVVTTPPGSTVGVRCPAGVYIPAGPVERFVRELCLGTGHVTRYWQPISNGREGVYRRDFEMVEQADRVMAFFAPGREMDGGTGHVVEAALARGIPVEAYRISDQGRLELLGSDDGALNGGLPGPLQTQMGRTP